MSDLTGTAAPGSGSGGTPAAASPAPAPAADTGGVRDLGSSSPDGGTGAQAAAAVAAPEPAPAPEPAAAAPDAPKTPEAPKPGDFKPHTDTPTLVETAGQEAPKPDAETPKPGEAPQPGPDAPKYEKFTVPDGFTLPDEVFTQATTLMGGMGITQENAQKLADFHTGAMQKYATDFQENQLRAQHETFGRTRMGWQDQGKADEEIGGSRWDTTIQNVAQMRDLFVAPERMKAFSDMMRATGVGDHPEFLRLMNAVATRFKEPAKVQQDAPRPPKDAGRAPGGRKATLYDHVSSRERAGRR